MKKPEFAGLGNYAYSNDEVTMEYTLEDGNTFWVRMKQAGGANKAFEKLEAALFKPFARKIEKGTLPREKRLELGAKLYAKTIITAWGGLFDPSGTEIPCTEENAIALLTQYEPLFDEIYQDARNKDHFTGTGDEGAVKNSPKPSGGGSNGEAS